MTARDHNKLLSIFFLVQGGLQTLAAVFVIVFYGLFGVIFGATIMSAAKGEDKLMGPVFGGFFIIFAILIGFFIMLFAGLDLIAGWKLHKQRSSAKIWALIASCVALPAFPLGTALGAYGLWFLFGDMGKQLYSGGSHGDFANTPPPPPQSWK